GLFASAALGAPVGRALVRGEDDVIDAEAAARTVEALRTVLGEMEPDERALFDKCYGYGQSMLAASEGGKRSYRTLVRRYHMQLAHMGARLDGLGVKEMPRWTRGVSGRVFDVEPANDEPGGGER